MRHYGNKPRTLKDKRAELVTWLTLARSIDGVEAADLARRKGLPLSEVEHALGEARARRNPQLNNGQTATSRE